MQVKRKERQEQKRKYYATYAVTFHPAGGGAINDGIYRQQITPAGSGA